MFFLSCYDWLSNVGQPGDGFELKDGILAFTEYFRSNFDYCDCNASGRVYKFVDLKKRHQPAMTMNQIFDYWKSINTSPPKQ